MRAVMADSKVAIIGITQSMNMAWILIVSVGMSDVCAWAEIDMIAYVIIRPMRVPMAAP